MSIMHPDDRSEPMMSTDKSNAFIGILVSEWLTEQKTIVIRPEVIPFVGEEDEASLLSPRYALLGSRAKSMLGPRGVVSRSSSDAAARPPGWSTRKLRHEGDRFMVVKDVEEQDRLREIIRKAGSLRNEIALLRHHIPYPLPAAFFADGGDHVGLNIEGKNNPFDKARCRQGEGAVATSELDHVFRFPVQAKAGKD